MDTKRGFRLFSGAFAAIVVGSMAWTVAARADDARLKSSSPALVYPHQGPGVGSVKTPPFYDAAYLAYLHGRHETLKDLYFHRSRSSAVRQPDQRQGPGPWSSKAPGVH